MFQREGGEGAKISVIYAWFYFRVFASSRENIDIPTPAFLVDRSIVEQKLPLACARSACQRRRFPASCEDPQDHRDRAHAAWRQPRSDHCFDVAEAEFFADEGFRDITYAVPNCAGKTGACGIAGSADRTSQHSHRQVAALRAVEEFHAANGVVFDVFLKVDCGYHRAASIRTIRTVPAWRIAISRSPAIHFQGLLTHAGHSYNAQDVETIRRIAAEETESLTRFRALIAGEGLAEVVRSIGSTPTTSVVDAFNDTDEVARHYVFSTPSRPRSDRAPREDVAAPCLPRSSARIPTAAKRSSTPGALAMSKDTSPDHLRSEFRLRHRLADLALRPMPLAPSSVAVAGHGEAGWTRAAGGARRIF